MVRRLARRILERSGYAVLEATNGEALCLPRDGSGPIHLTVTTVAMPLMGGRELARHIADLHPNAAILFMSGYTDAEGEAEIIRTGRALLRKPATSGGKSCSRPEVTGPLQTRIPHGELVEKVRQALEADRSDAMHRKTNPDSEPRTRRRADPRQRALRGWNEILPSASDRRAARCGRSAVSAVQVRKTHAPAAR